MPLHWGRNNRHHLRSARNPSVIGCLPVSGRPLMNSSNRMMNSLPSLTQSARNCNLPTMCCTSFRDRRSASNHSLRAAIVSCTLYCGTERVKLIESNVTPRKNNVCTRRHIFLFLFLKACLLQHLPHFTVGLIGLAVHFRWRQVIQVCYKVMHSFLVQVTYGISDSLRHIAEDRRPIGIVVSKYHCLFHISPNKFQSAGSVWICLYALFKSLFIIRHPSPFFLTSSTSASTEGWVSSHSFPRYVPFCILSLTDWPGGKLRSMMTRLSVESLFSLVLKGDTIAWLLNGFPSNGPNRVPCFTLSCIYEVISSGKSSADLWFVGVRLSRNSSFSTPIGHPYLQNCTISQWW